LHDRFRPFAWFIVGAIAALAVLVPGAPAVAQPAARRAVDISALITYPGFYHGQPVVLRAELVLSGATMVLVHPDEERALRVLASTGAPTPEGLVEARGTFWDVGRLQPDDPRVVSGHLAGSVESDPETAWPKPGELFVLQLTDAFAVDAATEPGIRDIVLDPRQHVDREVTITGQFRGRNLFGDIAQAPGISRWDFVVRSADAALWVTGTRPRGRGFDLNVNTRIDTNRWLEVTGTVRHAQGLVWLESVTLAEAETPAEPSPPSERAPRQVGPPPAVVFSSPTPDDIAVGHTTDVRMQFSRDMDPDTFEGRIRVTFADQGGGDVPAFAHAYDGATRSVRIAFADPWPVEAAFRRIAVELLDGITARDGAPMPPWTLTFELGGN